jgi:hypothetical protein
MLLLTWAPMTTFCLWLHRANDGWWFTTCQDHGRCKRVSTSFATGMLHRPCIARLIAGIRRR